MLCIAGIEKSGKSYSAAQFSASDLIDRTFYIELGEGAADQYGEIAGARYEINEHDGTFNSILGQAQASVAAPRGDRPHAIVVDSLTELWDLLSDEAQAKANRRAAMKAAEKKRPAPAEDVQITMDLWNEAKKKWRRFLDVLRVHDGPVILLARLELVVVMEGGKPSEAREWKIRAEKNLPFECDAIVKMYAPQSAFLTGVRSTRLQVPPGKELPLPQFTIDGLLRSLGLDEVGATAPRSYTAPRVDLSEAPDASMTRQPPRADDDWNTATGRPLPPPSPSVPSATDEQINEIVRLLGVKRSVYGDDCGRAVSELVRRRVDDPKTLSAAEARSIIETLTAEDDLVPLPSTPEPPAAAEPPANAMGVSRGKMKAMHALLTKQGHTKAGGHALMSRVTGRTITSANELTPKEVDAVIHALNTGEIPAPSAPEPPEPPEPPGPNANGEGFSEYDVLDQMILDVTSDEARAEVEQAITVELGRGTITATGAGVLRRRLAEHVAQAKAGASA
jgi:hypothetical protein